MWFMIAAFFIIAFVAIYRYLCERNNFFKALNVPGPEPTLLVGNLRALRGVPLGIKLSQWSQQYGKVYGYYEGSAPILVTSDLDILHDVFVKQFENFHGRKLFPLQPDPDNYALASIFMSRGLRWKRLRTVANPAVSVANFKNLLPTFDMTVNSFMEIMEEQCQLGEPFNIHPYFQHLTYDLIIRVAFGEQEDLQSNIYFEMCRELFPAKLEFKKNIYNTVGMILPEVNYFTNAIYNILTNKLAGFNPWFELSNKVYEIVHARRLEKTVHASQRKIELIQLFLEAECEITQKETVGEKKLDKTNMKVAKEMTTDEIVGQLIFFIVAGFDTTSNSLSYVAYLLATHPEVQEKLRAEIDLVCPRNGEITHEELSKLKYLELVIRETLRLYPLAAPLLARQCMSSTNVGGKLKQGIPKGLAVAADVWSIHYDKSIWGDDADQFRPERFQEDVQRHPMAWMPFGAGQRNCLGIRFAMIEQKVAISRLLQRFIIKKCAQTQVPLRLHGTAIVITPDSVDIRLERRSDI